MLERKKYVLLKPYLSEIKLFGKFRAYSLTYKQNNVKLSKRSNRRTLLFLNYLKYLSNNS